MIYAGLQCFKGAGVLSLSFAPEAEFVLIRTLGASDLSRAVHMERGRADDHQEGHNGEPFLSHRLSLIRLAAHLRFSSNTVTWGVYFL